jgi:DNA-binding CsgD family transcriptional regulator
MANLLQDLQQTVGFRGSGSGASGRTLAPTSSIERTDWSRSTLRAAFCRIVGLLKEASIASKTCPSERRPLSVTVAPMRRETAWSLAAPPLAIVFVVDPEREAEMSDVRLRAFYGVTPTEATIARLISRGTGVKAAARVLGIAPSTARTHLHRVFEKTGTSRQAELTNLVNSLASLSGNLTE